jgi:hypothetical protein
MSRVKANCARSLANSAAILSQAASLNVNISFSSKRYNLKMPTRSQSQKLEVFIIRTSQMFMYGFTNRRAF